MSSHRVQHTPSTVSTQDWLYSIGLMITSWPLNVALPSGVPPFQIDRHQPALHERSNIKSPCHIPPVASQLTDEWSQAPRHAVHRLPQSTWLIWINHSLQVHLETHSITTSRCMSKHTLSRPQSASPMSLDHSLQLYLWTHTITTCKFPRSLPPHTSPHFLEHSLQLSLYTCTIMASKYS